MPGTVKIEVKGLREIEAAMKELGVQASNRIARSALNRSATSIVRNMKERVPVSGEPLEPGEKRLKDSITKRLRRQRRAVIVKRS